MAVNKKVYWDPGHGGSDPGAVGFEVERDLAVKVINCADKYLKENYSGVLTKISKGTSSTRERSAEANKWKADILVSLHFNAGKGDGYEALIYSEANESLGELFEKHVKAVGQNSRGVKHRPDLNVLSMTNMKAILNEIAFVDNKKDILDWDENSELNVMGQAIAKATAEYLKLTKKKTSSGEKPSDQGEFKVKVKAGSLRIRKGPGTTYDVVDYINDHGVYRIVETKNGFGKLKSGAGWISMNAEYVTKM